MSRPAIRTQDHAEQVNRHLVSVSYLLTIAEELSSGSKPWQQRALSESALLQLYLALQTYLNEITSCYSTHYLPVEQTNLAEFLEKIPDNLRGVAEIGELQQSLLSSGQPWQTLCDLPMWLANTEKQREILGNTSTATSQDPQKSSVKVEFIELKAQEEGEGFLSPKAIRLMVNTLIKLVEQQRNNQAEF
ncbi:MAG: hypothetical protein ACJA04_000029 [Cellvibrionaceae bacterium]|jgi:hypothetical protein